MESGRFCLRKCAKTHPDLENLAYFVLTPILLVQFSGTIQMNPLDTLLIPEINLDFQGDPKESGYYSQSRGLVQTFI